MNSSTTSEARHAYHPAAPQPIGKLEAAARSLAIKRTMAVHAYILAELKAVPYRDVSQDFTFQHACFRSAAGREAFKETFNRLMLKAANGQPVLWGIPDQPTNSDCLTMHVFVPASQARSGRH